MSLWFHCRILSWVFPVLIENIGKLNDHMNKFMKHLSWQIRIMIVGFSAEIPCGKFYRDIAMEHPVEFHVEFLWFSPCWILCGNSAESSLVLSLWKFHFMFRCFLLGLLDSAINSSRIDIQIAQQLYSISWDSIKVEILNRSQLQPCKNSRELPCFYIPN